MAKSSDSKKKVLLADDSVTMHRAVSLALKNQDYELICCDNGKDALRLMYEHHPVVALLDLDMPEKTGIEVAQDVKNDPALADIQLVLLCGSFDEVDENEVDKAPVDGRLWKPFESNVLLTLLKTLLEAREKELSLQQKNLKSPTAQASVENTEKNVTEKNVAEKNIFEAPKSRKDNLLEQEENRVAKSLDHRQANSQKLKASVEETAAMSVEDLFSPRNRNLPPPTESLKFNSEETKALESDQLEYPNFDLEDDSFSSPSYAEEETSQQLNYSNEETSDNQDFSRSLTRETFHKIIDDDEPSGFHENLDPTSPPIPTSKSSARPSEDPFAQNLWSSEEISPIQEESHYANEDRNTSIKSDKTSDSQDFEFEILESFQSNDKPHESRSNRAEDWMSEQGRGLATPELDDVIKQGEFEAAQRIHHEFIQSQSKISAPKKSDPYEHSSDMSDEKLKNIVHSEVQRVFNTWLKDELKRQLDQVMSELDEDR